MDPLPPANTDGVEFWHWIATGITTVLLSIMGILWSRTTKQIDEKADRRELATAIDEAKQFRQEQRDNMLRLFERAEAHDRKDADRFEQLTKDFNGGLNRLADQIRDLNIQQAKRRK